MKSIGEGDVKNDIEQVDKNRSCWAQGRLLHSEYMLDGFLFDINFLLEIELHSSLIMRLHQICAY